jgi:transposase
LQPIAQASDSGDQQDAAQTKELSVSPTGLIDLHSHLLPGIDDGCPTFEESLACVRTLLNYGFTGTVCTPHVGMCIFPENTPAKIATQVGALQQQLSAAGRSKPSIAYDLGCSVGTVDIVRRRYRERGLAGLAKGNPPGRTSRATPEYRAALRIAVETPPQSLGYGFSVWSLARLNAHLARETKISFSDDQLGRIMHAEGFSVQRPKHTMRGKRDEAAYDKARRQLKRLKKGRWPKIALLS